MPPLQSYLTSELMKLKKLTVNVMNCIKVLPPPTPSLPAALFPSLAADRVLRHSMSQLLDEVFRANLVGRKLKAEDFHNELIRWVASVPGQAFLPSIHLLHIWSTISSRGREEGDALNQSREGPRPEG